MESKIIAFDLDDTLCTRPRHLEHLGPDKYLHCEPIPDMIELCNSLYDKGHIIYIYTARGMTQYQGNLIKIHHHIYQMTLDSLKEWGVKHHGLFLGKIVYDYFIDDKAMSLTEGVEILKKL
jgi:hydroxymethylpyrimidine pyrophosphatase-like HAD family hydrolase